MRRSTIARAGALGAAAALLALGLAPAHAEETVAQATATAVIVGAAGDAGGGTGPVRALHDGSRELVYGSRRPALKLAGNQDAVAVGTLAQDASASLRDGAGHSQACSGIAGEGATAVAVGDPGSCLRPGRALTLDVGSLDLTGLKLVGGTMPAQFPDVQKQLADAGLSLDLLLEPVSQGLQQGLRTFGSPGLHLDVGAIQSACQAGPGQLSADANLADVSLYLQLPALGEQPARRVDLLDLPVHPEPNTELVTGLDDVTGLIVAALRHQIELALTEENPLAMGADQFLDLMAPVVDQLSTQLAQALQPVQDNLLQVTMNAQQRAGGAITVSALDVRVLPAARQFIDADALRLQLANSTCGPNKTVEVDSPQPVADPEEPATSKPRAPAKVPTVVPAGLASAPTGSDGPGGGTLAWAGLAVLGSIAAGSIAYHRVLRR